MTHQVGHKVLGGEGVFFDVVYNDVLIPFTEVVAEVGGLHQMRVKHLNGEGEIQQAVRQTKFPKAAGGFGRVRQQFELIGFMLPHARLPCYGFLQGETVEGGAVEDVNKLADDALRAQAQVGESSFRLHRPQNAPHEQLGHVVFQEGGRLVWMGEAGGAGHQWPEEDDHFPRQAVVGGNVELGIRAEVGFLDQFQEGLLMPVFRDEHEDVVGGDS